MFCGEIVWGLGFKALSKLLLRSLNVVAIIWVHR